MQKLEGEGLAFVHAGGTLAKRRLQAGETLRIDTGGVVGYEAGVNFDIKYVGKLKSAIFGGEGLFFAELSGPGAVRAQSLPISRLAGRILATALRRGGSKGEGSILGGVGNLLNGDYF